MLKLWHISSGEVSSLFTKHRGSLQNCFPSLGSNMFLNYLLESIFLKAKLNICLFVSVYVVQILCNVETIFQTLAMSFVLDPIRILSPSKLETSKCLTWLWGENIIIHNSPSAMKQCCDYYLSFIIYDFFLYQTRNLTVYSLLLQYFRSQQIGYFLYDRKCEPRKEKLQNIMAYYWCQYLALRTDHVLSHTTLEQVSW